MKVKSILIECDMPGCTELFQAQFVTAVEMARYNTIAKREGWREVRQGSQMVHVCPGHPEVL